MKNFLYLFIGFAFFVISCKKSAPAPDITTNAIGLYQYQQDSAKRVFVLVSKVGTLTVNYPSVFDTGSAGMTMDAHGIIPSSMITSDGLKITGDSTIVNGITITSQQVVISYGDRTGMTKEYGNLAFAPITIGNQSGHISSKRVPMFLYYKVVDGAGNQQSTNHSLDVFGVGPGISTDNSSVQSPLRYFVSDPSLTSGFKLAMLKNSSFGTTSPNYVGGLLTIGLTQADINSSGFIMHYLNRFTIGGYSPNIPSIITFNGQSINAQVLFDSGTPSVSIIENELQTNSIGKLPVNTKVTITTNKGFVYTYITKSATNFTALENPDITDDYRTIFSIDFFINNEYLTDYTDHQIGLKNN